MACYLFCHYLNHWWPIFHYTTKGLIFLSHQLWITSEKSLHSFTAHDVNWQRKQDSPRPQPCCYSSYSRLFLAPLSDLSACRADDMSRKTCPVVYKQMQSNQIIWFWLQPSKVVDFSQLVFQTFCLLKHKRTYLYKFHFIKKHNATWISIASFWTEAVL